MCFVTYIQELPKDEHEVFIYLVFFFLYRAASIAASVIGSQEGRKQKLVIWPEWNDADVNAEKWVSTKSCHLRANHRQPISGICQETKIHLSIST